MNTSRATGRPASRGAKSAKGGRSGLIFGIVLVVLVGIGVIAVISTKSSTKREPFVLRNATVTGESLSLYSETQSPDPAVGKPAPAITGQDFTGRPFSVTPGGTAKLIVFLAHWCPHCRAEVPLVVDWLNSEEGPAQADVIAIATAIDKSQPNYPPDVWLEREGWPRGVIVDGDNAVQQAYGLNAFPYWVALKPDGTVAARQTGELTVTEMQALVDKATA